MYLSQGKGEEKWQKSNMVINNPFLYDQCFQGVETDK